jgi:hypothetical protein
MRENKRCELLKHQRCFKFPFQCSCLIALAGQKSYLSYAVVTLRRTLFQGRTSANMLNFKIFSGPDLTT